MFTGGTSNWTNRATRLLWRRLTVTCADMSAIATKVGVGAAWLGAAATAAGTVVILTGATSTGGAAVDLTRVAQGGCFAAVYDLVAAGSGALEGIGHVKVLGLVDGLDAVGVVVCHCVVGGPLDEAVDAAVDDHEGVDVQDRVLAVVVDEGAVGDLLVLGFEVGREGGAVAAALICGICGWKVLLWQVDDLHRTLLRLRFASH